MVLSEADIARAQIRQGDEQINIEKQRTDNDPQAIYADTLREEKIANVLDQINPDNLLSDIEHRIRGEKKNAYTNQWEPISKTPKKINDELVTNFISFLGSILNQNVSMSNFTDTEINNIMNMIISYVKQDLTVNAEKYEIEGNYVEMSRIGNIICIACFSTFKQALSGNLSKRIFGTLKIDASLMKENNKMEALKFWK